MRKNTDNISNKLSKKELILGTNKNKFKFNILKEYEVLAQPSNVFNSNHVDDISSEYYNITLPKQTLTHKFEQKYNITNNILPHLKLNSFNVSDSENHNKKISLKSSKEQLNVKNLDEKINNLFKDLYSIDKIDKIILEQKKYESFIKDKEDLLKISNNQKIRVIKNKILKEEFKPNIYSRNKNQPINKLSINTSILTDNFFLKESPQSRRKKNTSSTNQLSTQITNHKTIASLRKDTNVSNACNIQSYEKIITQCNQQLKLLNKTFKSNKKKTVILDNKINKLFGKIFEGYKTRQEREFSKEVISYLKNQGAFIYGEKSGNYHNNVNLFR